MEHGLAVDLCKHAVGLCGLTFTRLLKRYSRATVCVAAASIPLLPPLLRLPQMWQADEYIDILARCSIGASKHLAMEPGWNLQVVERDDELVAPATSLLQRLWGDENASSTECAETRKAEYLSLYQPQGYHAQGAELRADIVIRLLTVLQLSADDFFIDLGSSRGGLPLAAALFTQVGTACGIEISPSRHRLASDLHKRLLASGGWVAARACRARLQEGDMLHSSVHLLSRATVRVSLKP